MCTDEDIDLYTKNHDCAFGTQVARALKKAARYAIADNLQE
jgi:hypothetical protein